jgi:hypothetical protein
LPSNRPTAKRFQLEFLVGFTLELWPLAVSITVREINCAIAASPFEMIKAGTLFQSPLFVTTITTLGASRAPEIKYRSPLLIFIRFQLTIRGTEITDKILTIVGVTVNTAALENTPLTVWVIAA